MLCLRSGFGDLLWCYICVLDYAVNDLGIPAEDALNRVREFGSKYGTSLAGFVVRKGSLPDHGSCVLCRLLDLHRRGWCSA